MSTQAAVASGPARTDIFGHPRGLWYLCFAEAWERFSYYGMLSLLALYMTKQLFLPGHVENIAFFGEFRHLMEGVFGPLSPQALALQIAGLYGGVVYFTPVFGGFIADSFLGRTASVTLGALLMALGHFLMAFEVSFLAALACLIVGVGLFKGNIATQVGALYAPGDLRRGTAFQAYLLGIQIAVIISPLVCGYLGEKVAWHWGFGCAGVGMLIGLIVYLSGRKWLPPDKIIGADGKQHKPRLAAGEWKTILVLLVLVPVLGLASLGNQQIFGAYLIWGEAHYNMVFMGQTVPTESLVSLDAFISMVTLILVVAFWRLWSVKFKEPDEIWKIVIGTLIAAGAPLMLALGSLHEVATGEKVSITYGLGFHIFNDIGFAMVFPIGLALYSRAAPSAVKSLMIGVYYLNIFLCTTFAGYLGRYLETMTGANFWFMHAGLIALGGVLLALFAFAFHRILAPTADPEAAQA